MVFLTKRHVSRRTLLRGIGAGIALPLLDAMIPAGVALAQTAAVSKPRMGFFYLPHGAVMDQWTPAATGKDYALSPILKPFEKVRGHMTVISGLDNKPAHSSSVHAITPGTWLGCVAPHRTHVPFGGITVDQLAAAKIGQDTPLPSMEVAVEEAGGTAACDGVYGCSFGKTIAFRTPSAPLPMETRPRKLFERMFGRGTSETEREAINADFRSILDMVSEETATLSRRLGASDRATLATYLESVREMERRVDRLGERRLDEADLPDLPAWTAGVRRTRAAHVRPDRDGLSGGCHADHHLHDGSGSEQSGLYPHRDCRCIPSAVTPQQQPGCARETGEAADLSQRAFRGVPAEAGCHPRRGGKRAGQLDIPLRQQHE